MLEVDFHTHTLFSTCGIHTVLEIAQYARGLKMKGVAITDHGLTLGGHLNNPFFERFVSPFPDLKILKGIECNLLNKMGKIDLPQRYIQWLDIVLLGIHQNIPKGQGKSSYTKMMIRALERNPEIDIIAHANDPNYGLDYPAIASAAKEHGVAIELNNSKILYARTSKNEVIDLIEACGKTGCFVAINSDMHAIGELGRDDMIRPLLDKSGFPSSLIVNRNAERAFAFIDERLRNKR
jgi:putative hydrolase